jgi:hypothetical protein
VQPGAVTASCLSDLVERVECAGVDIARLRAHDRGPIACPQGPAQTIETHATLVFGFDTLYRARSESQHA